MIVSSFKDLMEIITQFWRHWFKKFSSDADLTLLWKVKVDKIEKRPMTKCLFICEMPSNEIHDDMFNTLRDDVPSCTVVKTYIAEFTLGQISVINEH